MWPMYQVDHVSGTSKHSFQGLSKTKSTFEAMANRQNDDKDQCDDDTQNNQFNLHILDPHLPSHLRPLLSEILCLQQDQ